jgi:hypothetical protein
MRILDVSSPRLGLQQPALAARLGIAQANHWRIETRHSTATIEQLPIAADAFRKTPVALLAGFILALALSGPS